MEFTEEMLDSIEAVKGVRDEKYWDGRCQQYFESNKKSVKPKVSTSSNETASSS